MNKINSEESQEFLIFEPKSNDSSSKLSKIRNFPVFISIFLKSTRLA